MRCAITRPLFVAALSLLSLAACQPKATPMTAEETQHIAQLTAHMSPRCVGRYLVDLPDKFVLNSQSRSEIEGVTIQIEPMKQWEFEQIFDGRRRTLTTLMQPGKDRNRPHLRKTIPLTSPSLGAVFDRAESNNTSDRSGRVFELMAWRDGYQIKATIKATDLSFPEDADDPIAKQLKTDVVEKLAHLLNVYERTRGRKDDEVPTEQGLCFANGFVKGPPTDQEWIDMYHHLDGVRDVYFTYHYLSDIGPQKTSLLERGNDIEKGLRDANGATLRKGRTERNGMQIEEWLLRRQGQHGTMLYDHTLEINSKQGNASHPLFTLDFTSGVEHPVPQRSLEEQAVYKPVEKSTLSETESIALWDKVTATLRPRPGAF